MKTISILVIASLLFMSQNSFAENVKLRYKEKMGTVETHGITVDQVQAKLRCVFFHKKKGGFLIRRRYAFTQIQSQQDFFDIKIKKSSLTEWLPGFKVESCAFVLVTLGKDLDGRTRMGDVVLLGQLNGTMSQADLAFMQNKDEVDAYLSKRLQNLKLGLKRVRGKTRIAEVD